MYKGPSIDIKYIVDESIWIPCAGFNSAFPCKVCFQNGLHNILRLQSFSAYGVCILGLYAVHVYKINAKLGTKEFEQEKKVFVMRV